MPRPTSTELHRAKRARERASIDSELADADDHLDHVRQMMTVALVAVMQGRNLDAMQRITAALAEIDSARRFLIATYDSLWRHDDAEG